MENQYKIKSINLKIENLCLKQFEKNDLPNIFLGLSNPAVTKYYGVRYNSLEATLEQLKWFDNLQINGTGIWWAIFSADHHSFYGGIGFNNFDTKHQKIEIGFWLLPEFWGNDIIRKSLNLVTDYAFNTLKINRIEAFVEIGNENSVKFLLKNGFTYEETIKDCEIKEGKFISLEIYAIYKVPEVYLSPK